MFKFKSICPMSLIVTVDGVMKSIKPNQEFTSKNYINNNFIVECVPEKIPICPKCESENEHHEHSTKTINPSKILTKSNDTFKNYKKQIKDES